MKAFDVRFLSVEDVLAIHESTIAVEGGQSGLRDTGLLESATLMPQQQFGGDYLHADTAAMAAAYLFHLSQNHPFLDGDKRVAALSALVFLRVNGVESLQGMTMAVASSEVGKSELTKWMRQQISR